MMKATFLLGLLFASAASAGSPATGPDLKLMAADYVAAQEAVMEIDAGAKQMERLVGFYAPGYTYYHPAAGAKVTGADTIRSGISSHFGETKDAEIRIDGILRSGDTLSVATDTRFTLVADGTVVHRSGLIILTFKDGKIVQRVDI